MTAPARSTISAATYAAVVGRVVTEDLRAQLILRPRATRFGWPELDRKGGFLAHDKARVFSGGAVAAGLYVAGWAGRDPSAVGAHAADADAVVTAIHADAVKLPSPEADLTDIVTRASTLGGWSAVAATERLLDRLAAEGQAPLADYQALLAQADDD